MIADVIPQLIRTSPKRRKRDEVQVIISVLKCLSDSPCNKTAIMLFAKLDTRMSRKYVRFIQDTGMIMKDGSSQYKITEKGIELLTYYDKIQQMIRQI